MIRWSKIKKFKINFKNHTETKVIQESKIACLDVLEIKPINVPEKVIIHHGNKDARMYVITIYIEILVFI